MYVQLRNLTQVIYIINGAKAHCICIYVDDIDDYENIENDEDLPF